MLFQRFLGSAEDQGGTPTPLLYITTPILYNYSIDLAVKPVDSSCWQLVIHALSWPMRSLKLSLFRV